VDAWLSGGHWVAVSSTGADDGSGKRATVKEFTGHSLPLRDARHGQRRAWPGGTWEDFRPCRAVLVRVYFAAAAQARGAETHGVFIRLDRAESMRLLASAQVGQLIHVNALPAVRLMNLAMAGGLILLRGDRHHDARKVPYVIVALEADDLDAATSSGWSVVVTGRAMRVTGPELIARCQHVPLPPWAPGDRNQFMTITTGVVEGRQVRRKARSTDPGHGPEHDARHPRRG